MPPNKTLFLESSYLNMFLFLTFMRKAVTNKSLWKNSRIFHEEKAGSFPLSQKKMTDVQMCNYYRDLLNFNQLQMVRFSKNQWWLCDTNIINDNNTYYWNELQVLCPIMVNKLMKVICAFITILVNHYVQNLATFNNASFSLVQPSSWKKNAIKFIHKIMCFKYFFTNK